MLTLDSYLETIKPTYEVKFHNEQYITGTRLAIEVYKGEVMAKTVVDYSWLANEDAIIQEIRRMIEELG